MTNKQTKKTKKTDTDEKLLDKLHDVVGGKTSPVKRSDRRIGNQFWKARTTHGRKRKFTTATLWEGCVEFFQWCDDNPLIEEKAFHTDGRVTFVEVPKMRAMTIGGLCIFLDICEETWSNYRRNKDFMGVTTRADQIIRAQKFTGAAADMLNPNIIARDLGLSDKQDTRHSGEIKSQFVFVPVSSADEPD